MCSGGLTRVVNDEDGDAVVALYCTQRGEDPGYVCSGVLVDAGESNEGIEDEQSRLMALNGGAQAKQIVLALEADGGDVEEIDGEGIEVESSDTGQSFETFP